MAEQEIKEAVPSVPSRKSGKKEFVGTVKSDKMMKTIVVRQEGIRGDGKERQNDENHRRHNRDDEVASFVQKVRQAA